MNSSKFLNFLPKSASGYGHSQSRFEKPKHTFASDRLVVELRIPQYETLFTDEPKGGGIIDAVYYIHFPDDCTKGAIRPDIRVDYWLRIITIDGSKTMPCGEMFLPGTDFTGVNVDSAFKMGKPVSIFDVLVAGANKP